MNEETKANDSVPDKTSIAIKVPTAQTDDISSPDLISEIVIDDSSDFSHDFENPKLGKADRDLKIFKPKFTEISPLFLPKPYDLLPESFTDKDAVKSYVSNNPKEEMCLEFVDNFARQYRLLYKDRKPLLLAPRNEYDVKKFISTYIKPTKLPFRDLYTWESISSFVSDYLHFVPVLPSTEFPKRILSSTKVLEILKGTSFEFANLLCSLLLGVGYDAYCVVGYATRECCFMDQSRSDCPLLKPPTELVSIHKHVAEPKYVVKPPKDRKSKFEVYNEARKIQETNMETKRLEKENEIEERIKEKPPIDPLSGLRVHCWIIVKALLRDVLSDFFIDPLTGLFVDIKDEMYQGIESVFNDQNCWINMQDCSTGIQQMEYNFDDLKYWEFVLPSSLKYQNAKVVSLSSSYMSSVEIMPELNEPKKKIVDIFECPESWISKIEIQLSDYERRFPENNKKIVYRKVKCEQFSPYLNKNGLILRLTIFTDRSLTDVVELQEHFSNREDKLFKTIKKDGWTTEYFHEGRSYQMKEHRYETAYPEHETKRTLDFYNLRVDGLVRREESPTTLTEFYCGRQDNLIYMSCDFTKRAIKFSNNQLAYRNIEMITKRFQRNYDVSYTKDVKEIIFYLNEDRISITYHVDTFGLISNIREFIKPPMSQDGKNVIPFYSDTHTLFQANAIGQEEESRLEVYQFLLQLIDEERKSKDIVRWSESETKFILQNRRTEKSNHVLGKSLYDSLRNEEAKTKRIELEMLDEAEKNKRKEDDLDFLGPFLSQMNLNDITTQEHAFSVREECLQDFKVRLIEKANIIQLRYEAETSLLQKNQQWYQQNQQALTKEDEKSYLKTCNYSTLKINTLETMLSKHKQVAPHKYMSLERKIRNDPRMKPYLSG